uniref:Chemokine interleukin-8-like domain-containing protein n=1 Tax=Sinocyclocheilus anshuiensis TaxID=1608454 RepID=A0A671L7M3_9TELE
KCLERLKCLILLKCLEPVKCLECLKCIKLRFSTRNRVTSYSIQKPDGHCNIPAVVFRVDRDHKFCANPQKYWVRILIERVDAMLKGLIKGRKLHNSADSNLLARNS